MCNQAASQVALAITKHLLLNRIEQLAITDHLTQWYNRRGLADLGRREIERAIRYKRPLCAIMIDIDHFKNVNDTYGHHTGDLVLQALSERCRYAVRETDILCRYGGEEFLLLLPENVLPLAVEVGERLRRTIADLAVLSSSGETIQITASLGVAAMDAGVTDLDALIWRADQALYSAKCAGRNRVEVYPLLAESAD